MASEYKIKMELIQQQLDAIKVDGNKPETAEGIRIYEALEAELIKVKDELINAVLTGEPVPIPVKETPAASETAQYTLVMRLTNAVNNLQTFNGSDAENTSKFISQIDRIATTIPVDWETFRSSILQRVHINVYKALKQYEETTKITNLDGLKKFLLSQYGVKSSIPQRLEKVWYQSKARSETWPTWANGLEGQMTALENSLLEQRRAETANPNYELTAKDAFQLFQKLKFLTELKSESSELYRVITAETDQLKTVSQMAHRAELLKTQSITSSAGSYATTKTPQLNPSQIPQQPRPKSNIYKSHSNNNHGRHTGPNRGTGHQNRGYNGQGNSNHGPNRGQGHGHNNSGPASRQKTHNGGKNHTGGNYQNGRNHGNNGHKQNAHNSRDHQKRNHGRTYFTQEMPEDDNTFSVDDDRYYFNSDDYSFEHNLN